MPIAKGVNKRVIYKKETAGQWGVIASATGATILRRVTADFNLSKETYESNELRTDFQVADMRHGVRSADGSLNGELSPGSYAPFMASVVARDFTAGATATGLSVTIAASGSLFTITRSAGSWLTDGFYVGNVFRLTGAGLNAANVGNNVLIVALTATIATVQVLSTTPLVAEGPIATVTATVAGKQTFAPLSGHTDDSYTVEEFYSDIAQSEVYTGMKVGSVDVKLPATGLVTADFTLKGKNLGQTGTTQYFTSPTAASSTGVLASVNGALVVNGTPVAIVTSLDFKIERGLEGATVVGSNTSADMFTGKIKVTGNFSAYFQDATFRNLFDQETVTSLVVALTTNSGKTGDFVTFAIPKIKLGSANQSDAEMGIVAQHSFTALLNDVTTAGLVNSSILITDSLA